MFYVIGPSGMYFPLKDAFIVEVPENVDELFTDLMDNEQDDLAWSSVIDSVPGSDIHIIVANCDNNHNTMWVDEEWHAAARSCAAASCRALRSRVIPGVHNPHLR